jgi:superfamily II helicase
LSNQKQSTIIRRDRLCHHCLEGPHFTRDCKTKEGRLCGIDGCKLYHHKVLHREPNSSKFVGFRSKTRQNLPKLLRESKQLSKLLKNL